MFQNDIKAPETVQATVDVQRQIGRKMMVSAGFVHTSGKNFPIVRNFANAFDRETGARPNPAVTPGGWYITSTQTMKYDAFETTFLDRGVVRALAADPAQAHTRFIVPLGVGAHLEKWGIDAARITELDWSESTRLGALTITATPARHFSGRGLTRNHTLWASFSIAGPAHRVFHSGDTGPFAGFPAIGAQHGPFDLTLIKIGAYGETWPDIHLTPEQAVDAHAQLRGSTLLPIHWGTFNLAFHAWDEPAERVVAAAGAGGARLVMPRPGESIEPASAPPVQPWWRRVRAP
jgi:L-ascorbate metabolism protein UlaG (beta-lactamase superfamily)